MDGKQLIFFGDIKDGESQGNSDSIFCFWKIGKFASYKVTVFINKSFFNKYVSIVLRSCLFYETLSFSLDPCIWTKTYRNPCDFTSKEPNNRSWKAKVRTSSRMYRNVEWSWDKRFIQIGRSTKSKFIYD